MHGNAPFSRAGSSRLDCLADRRAGRPLSRATGLAAASPDAWPCGRPGGFGLPVVAAPRSPGGGCDAVLVRALNRPVLHRSAPGSGDEVNVRPSVRLTASVISLFALVVTSPDRRAGRPPGIAMGLAAASPNARPCGRPGRSC